MATRKDSLGPILDAIPGASVRAMFGEYALYLEGKVIGLVCDDTLFLKNLPQARGLLPSAELAPAYPGSKAHIVADPWLDDPDTLNAAARSVAAALPVPKPKAARSAKPKVPE